MGFTAWYSNLTEKQVRDGKFKIQSLTDKLITPEYADEWYYITAPSSTEPWISAIPLDQVQAEIIKESGPAWGAS